MRSASVEFKPISKAGPAPSRLATSLTLAAMSLGYGVVQLDVTIVNTAVNAIGVSLGGGVRCLRAGAQCSDPDFRALCPGPGGRHSGAELAGAAQPRLS